MITPPPPCQRPRDWSLSSLKAHSSPIPIQSPLGDARFPGPRPLSNPAIMRPELCDAPPPSATLPSLCSSQQDQAIVKAVSDRAELIECLKRGESPTWIPSRRFESLLQLQSRRGSRSHSRSRSRSPIRVTKTPFPGLLPSASILSGTDRLLQREGNGRNGAGRLSPDIERPRSALHSGDFTTDQQHGHVFGANQGGAVRQLGVSPFPSRASSEPWIATPPSHHHHHHHHHLPLSALEGLAANARREAFGTGLSSLSSSLSSSFVYKAPTSPLVQAESNDDLDVGLPVTPGHLGSAISASQRQDYSAYQAHQPCRSLSSAAIFSASSSPQTPTPTPLSLPRSKFLSIGSESSPRSQQRTSMVGSYEESILRGRMSTNPSRPLEFTAQIGVLGLGKCKPSLRCPPHATLPFLAVFYRYPTTVASGRSPATPSEHGPSPYVGQIDLENGLPHPGEAGKRGAAMKRKAQIRAHAHVQGQVAGQGHSPARVAADQADDGSVVDDENGAIMESAAGPVVDDAESKHKHAAGLSPRLLLKQKRRSQSPRAPPGGAYRIPEKGQLQVVVKNQNKTAVKLFLVPYDLTGMEPGTKTFIRQRSYSAGPIIDQGSDLTRLDADAGTVKSQSSIGDDAAKGKSRVASRGGGAPVSPASASESSRPVLRYLIHVHICCPSKGRFYLYRSIRIVFANRVPDGKESLRNEISLPEPRFAPYKPVRVVGAQTQASTPAVSSHSPAFFRTPQDVFSTTLSSQSQTRPLMPPPFSFSANEASPQSPKSSAESATMATNNSRPARQQVDTDNGMVGLGLGPGRTLEAQAVQQQQSQPPGRQPCPFAATVSTRYFKLNKGDAGGPTGPHVAVPEGLLSMKLRSLGVKSPGGRQDDEVLRDADA